MSNASKNPGKKHKKSCSSSENLNDKSRNKNRNSLKPIPIWNSSFYPHSRHTSGNFEFVFRNYSSLATVHLKKVLLLLNFTSGFSTPWLRACLFIKSDTQFWVSDHSEVAWNESLRWNYCDWWYKLIGSRMYKCMKGIELEALESTSWNLPLRNVFTFRTSFSRSRR